MSAVNLQSPPGAAVTASATPAPADLGLVRCPRCWRWVPALGPTALGELCPRCTAALASCRPEPFPLSDPLPSWPKTKSPNTAKPSAKTAAAKKPAPGGEKGRRRANASRQGPRGRKIVETRGTQTPPARAKDRRNRSPSASMRSARSPRRTRRSRRRPPLRGRRRRPVTPRRTDVTAKGASRPPMPHHIKPASPPTSSASIPIGPRVRRFRRRRRRKDPGEVPPLSSGC